jgi:hypothetical protein
MTDDFPVRKEMIEKTKEINALKKKNQKRDQGKKGGKSE